MTSYNNDPRHQMVHHRYKSIFSVPLNNEQTELNMDRREPKESL